jgi:hypothetical protein
VLNAVGHSGEISIGIPTAGNVVLPEKLQELEDMLMLTDVGAVIPLQSL